MKRFYHQNEIKFECQPDCSNCCKLANGFVFLTDKEALEIAKNLAISENEFLRHFTRIIDYQLCLVDGENEHCIFLENHKCNIYEVRPNQCRTYPFWPENFKSRSRWLLTKDECPGIGKARIYAAEEVDAILKNK